MNFIIHYITCLPLQIQFSLINRYYGNGLNVEPSNTNKYITGTLHKGQGLRVGKWAKG